MNKCASDEKMTMNSNKDHMFLDSRDFQMYLNKYVHANSQNKSTCLFKGYLNVKVHFNDKFVSFFINLFI